MLASDARLSVHRRLSTTVSSKDKYFLGRDGGWWLNVGRGAVGLTVGCGAVSASFISGCFLLLYPALEETATLRLRLLLWIVSIGDGCVGSVLRGRLVVPR